MPIGPTAGEDYLLASFVHRTMNSEPSPTQQRATGGTDRALRDFVGRQMRGEAQPDETLDIDHEGLSQAEIDAWGTLDKATRQRAIDGDVTALGEWAAASK